MDRNISSNRHATCKYLSVNNCHLSILARGITPAQSLFTAHSHSNQQISLGIDLMSTEQATCDIVVNARERRSSMMTTNVEVEMATLKHIVPRALRDKHLEFFGEPSLLATSTSHQANRLAISLTQLPPPSARRRSCPTYKPTFSLQKKLPVRSTKLTIGASKSVWCWTRQTSPVSTCC